MSDNKEMQKEDIVFVQMEVMERPKFVLDKTEDIINWGKDNCYPYKLEELASSHPIHGSILKMKSRYLSGLGLKSSVDSPTVKNFLEFANNGNLNSDLESNEGSDNIHETWHDLRRKTDSDQVRYGGFAILIRSNIVGQPISFHHVHIGKCRINSAGTGLWFSNDWNASTRKTFAITKKFYPFYKKGIIGDSIYFVKSYSVSLNALDAIYPKQEYESAIMDISTDIAVTKCFHSLVKNGFSAGHIITFFNGEVKPEVKADIEKRFKENYQGEEGRRVALVFASKEGKGVEIATVDSANYADQYEQINKRNQQNIITGHNVPGVLLKIKTEGQLGERNEMDLAQSLFINEYAAPEQKYFNDIVKKFCFIKTGVVSEFTVEQFKLINTELDLNNQNIIDALNAVNPNIVTGYIIEKFGLKIPEGTVKIQPQQQMSELEQTGKVNDNIKNLTGRQRQNLEAILRKFNKGTYSEEQALMMLKVGFMLADEEARLWLGVNPQSIQMSSQDYESLFIEWAEKNVVEIDESDELLETTEVQFSNTLDVVKFEEVSKIKDKGFLDRLIDKIKDGFINGKKTELDREVYTVYKYGLRKDQKGTPLLLSTSRNFCKKMVNLTSGNKRLTFEKINEYNNEFGESAWDFRGGFYTKKGTNDTTNYCRHLWEAETRVKIKR